MAKSSTLVNSRGNSTELFILETLLKGENVVIPDFGHLELRTLGDRHTVLFKPTDDSDSFLSIVPAAGDKEKNDRNAIYTALTIPLKEEKTVNLPQVGLFQPKRRENGEIHISFIPSASLRTLLNNKEGDAIKDDKKVGEEVKSDVKDETNEIKKVAEEIKNKPFTPIQDIKGEVKKDSPIENKLSNTDEVNKVKPEVKSPLFPKTTNDIAPKVPSKPSLTPKAPVTKVVVDNGVKKPKTRNISGIFLIILAILFALLIVGAIRIYSQHTKNLDEQAELALPDASSSEFIDLPALAEQHYGNSAFWIYIFVANKDRLKSPIHIPISDSIVIPDLKNEFGVDVTDSMEVQRANILSDIVLKKEYNK